MLKIKLVVFISLAVLFSLVSVGVFARSFNKSFHLSRIGKAYGSTPSSDRWSPYADVNHDNVVDINDLALASKDHQRKTETAYTTESSSTIISVDPEKSYVGSVLKNFTINVDVTDAEPTWAWEINLSWNASLINFTNFTKGTFFPEEYTYCGYDPDHIDEGWVMIGCTLLDPSSPVSGNGILATINFTVLDEGSCLLDLYDTKLLDYNLDDYAHETNDGQFILCKGDVDRDGDVDPNDFAIFAGTYGTSPPTNLECDLDNDNDVDPSDFAIFAGRYGTTC